MKWLKRLEGRLDHISSWEWFSCVIQLDIFPTTLWSLTLGSRAAVFFRQPSSRLHLKFGGGLSSRTYGWMMNVLHASTLATPTPSSFWGNTHQHSVLWVFWVYFFRPLCVWVRSSPSWQSFCTCFPFDWGQSSPVFQPTQLEWIPAFSYFILVFISFHLSIDKSLVHAREFVSLRCFNFFNLKRVCLQGKGRLTLTLSR